MKYILLMGLSIPLALLLTSHNTKIDRKTKKALNEGYTFVPSGSLKLHQDSVTIQSFIMLRGEITNIHWKEFLSDLKSKGEVEKLTICQVDSAKWNGKGASMNPYAEFYHTHPAYNQYPVVNISKEAAELYCLWLTENFLPNKVGQTKLQFRLPTHNEWIYAAKGGSKTGAYAWGTFYLQNQKGQFQCNFVRLGAENITRDSNSRYTVKTNLNNSSEYVNYADVTAPSKSFWPNAFGLYNMNGNVAELIADKHIVAGGSWRDPGYDVRNESFQPYEGPRPTVGFRVVATARAKDLSWLKTRL